ncbi:hypothetical protein IM511_06820 [Erythrobacteraceae bacterium E2-1 Yellow Sea]|nr:hypothetical protein [Erythrobacteraceae bacterium E2-1 Yellow Sea]
MKKLAFVALASAGAMALSACGSADDASVDAEADTVEMPADAALTAVDDEPVDDENAAVEDQQAEAEEAEAAVAAAAADAAADVAAQAAAAAQEAGE